MTLFQLDKHQANGQKSIFPIMFYQQDMGQCLLCSTVSNMHGTHKNSPYGQTLRNQKNSLFFGFFVHAHRRTNWDSKFCGLGQKKNSGALNSTGNEHIDILCRNA